MAIDFNCIETSYFFEWNDKLNSVELTTTVKMFVHEKKVEIIVCVQLELNASNHIHRDQITVSY